MIRVLAVVSFFFISLTILGGMLLGLAAGLASFVATEYIDYTIPIVQLFKSMALG